jgi:hypothetical protein
MFIIIFTIITTAAAAQSVGLKPFDQFLSPRASTSYSVMYAEDRLLHQW